MDFLATTISMIPTLLRATPIVLTLLVGALAIAILLGMAIALLRIAKVPVLDKACAVFVEVMRGTPLLVQLFYIYYVLPRLGVQIEAVHAGILGLGLNYAAYLSEVFRASIASIDRGQNEAALSLGYTPAHAMFRIVIPQSLRVSIPPVGNYVISLVKDTSLTSVIAVTEIVKTANVVASTTFQVTEVYTAAALIYLAVSLPLSGLLRIVEWNSKKHVRT